MTNLILNLINILENHNNAVAKLKVLSEYVDEQELPTVDSFNKRTAYKIRDLIVDRIDGGEL